MRIDVHAHCYPTEYLDLLDRYGGSPCGTDAARNLRADNTPADLDARFRMMDAAGVDRQVLSMAPQLPYFDDAARAVDAARRANDLYAHLVQQHPDRFLAFACIPLPHVAAALGELARGLDELGMVGATIATSVRDRSIVDPAFEPFWAELDRRGTVLFIHSAGLGACSPLVQAYQLAWPIGAPLEDTMAIGHLMGAGITRRYPRVKIVTCHLGGALPLLVPRMDDHYRWGMPTGPDTPSVVAARLWYDTVGHGHVPALRAAWETFGAGRLLLGSDYPYQQDDEYQGAVTYVEAAGLSPADVRAILGGNAQALLGLESQAARGSAG
jgi:aminocarboxymuconate-semialdehyde decarboxylase